MEMDMNEKDLVVFEDEAGNQITLEVLDYLFYEGKEYALLCEMELEGVAEEDQPQREAYIMEVVPVGDDMEEFVPIDEALAEKLIDIFDNPEDLDEEFEDEE